ncbi:unnamed protein product, partial [Ectocarpus sp. 6 AP-2014]
QELEDHKTVKSNTTHEVHQQEKTLNTNKGNRCQAIPKNSFIAPLCPHDKATPKAPRVPCVSWLAQNNLHIPLPASSKDCTCRFYSVEQRRTGKTQTINCLSTTYYNSRRQPSTHQSSNLRTHHANWPDHI